MPTAPLRYRQVHMDFHTSADIPRVAAEFDAEQFADTLHRACVNSVTCFARCHHGWLYYDSKKFPDLVHPSLVRRNLLAEQIEACHKRDIRVPIYITVQWDHHQACLHPQWRIVEPDGRLSGTPPFEPGFYGNLCVNTPYAGFLKEITREVLESLPTDGIFFDIVSVRPCVCRRCTAGMLAGGLDPSDPADRRAYAVDVLDRFKLDMTAFVRRLNADCTIFYNAGHVGPYVRASQSAYTHFELESLPSGGWGYVHFPLSMRFARTLGPDCMGMTGKFHTSWGDFHSFKSRAALEFECFTMLALNGRCSVGDQLHPNGRICPHVYELIGSVYAEVARKEAWCVGASAVTDIGLLTPEEFTHERVPDAAAGAVRMLQEAAHQFDLLDSRSDFTTYPVLILPDRIPVDADLAARFGDYLAGGGKLIASCESGMNAEKTGFALDALGVSLRSDGALDSGGRPVRGRFVGRGMFVDYVLPKGPLAAGLPPTEHVMYIRGAEVDAADGAEVLAETIQPYFDRSWRRFCSHAQTPSSGRSAGPAVVRNQDAVYFAHAIFTEYNRNAPPWCKRLLLNALNLLLPQPLLRHDGPSTVLATVNAQAEHSRWVVHLLHYIPERRGREIDVIEDVIALHDLKLSVRTPQAVRAVRCVPEGAELDFTATDGRVEFVLPRLEGHQMIELAF